MTETKTPKTPSPKMLARKRTVADRKAIIKQVRTVERIAREFERTQEALQSEIGKLNGDVKTQLEQVLKQIGVAVTITNAEVEAQATALARTFVKQ